MIDITQIASCLRDMGYSPSDTKESIKKACLVDLNVDGKISEDFIFTQALKILVGKKDKDDLNEELKDLVQKDKISSGVSQYLDDIGIDE